jgi:hypothetical protein
MDADTVARLNVAVEDIVERCMSSNRKPPFTILADCVQQLRYLPGWTDQEIELVQAAAMRVLNERLSDSR